MRQCVHCGGKVKRVHRTFFERFRYMALFQCRKCGKIEPHPRLYTYNFGPFVRCPRCGTQRLSRLQSPDRIDRFHRSAASALNRMLGGSLFHCRFCRIQFYDRRPLKAEAPVEAVAEPK